MLLRLMYAAPLEQQSERDHVALVVPERDLQEVPRASAADRGLTGQAAAQTEDGNVHPNFVDQGGTWDSLSARWGPRTREARRGAFLALRVRWPPRRPDRGRERSIGPLNPRWYMIAATA